MKYQHECAKWQESHEADHSKVIAQQTLLAEKDRWINHLTYALFVLLAATSWLGLR